MSEEFAKRSYCAEGRARIRGSEIPYSAVSENFPIRGKDGTVDAEMFTFGYERSDVEDYSGRPVLFAWNGGPGCGSVFVHLGLLAPMIVDTGSGPDMNMTPPFRLIENENCLLDVCDLVAVDAIGTGYSRMLNPERQKDYFCTEGDAVAFIQCIRGWLDAHNRWNSPVYIMGESYGTIRNALVADYAFYHNVGFSSGAPIHLAGVIMVGTALDYGQTPFPIPSAVLTLPTIAATHWYWREGEKGSIEDFVAECEDFAMHDYLVALAAGSSLDEAERRHVAERLSYFTGYSAETLLKNKLEVGYWDFGASEETTQGKNIGLYDSRIAFEPVPYKTERDIFGDDPSNQVICPAFTALYNGVWKRELNIDGEGEYIEFAGASDSWDLKTKIHPAESLEKAMYRNPAMKLMFCVGYYDLLCTLGWVRYLVNHYALPKERTSVKCYEAGHMTYIGAEPARKMLDDMRRFLTE